MRVPAGCCALLTWKPETTNPWYCSGRPVPFAVKMVGLVLLWMQNGKSQQAVDDAEIDG